jgi:hypothetical protein
VDVYSTDIQSSRVRCACCADQQRHTQDERLVNTLPTPVLSPRKKDPWMDGVAMFRTFPGICNQALQHVSNHPRCLLLQNACYHLAICSSFTVKKIVTAATGKCEEVYSRKKRSSSRMKWMVSISKHPLCSLNLVPSLRMLGALCLNALHTFMTFYTGKKICLPLFFCKSIIRLRNYKFYFSVNPKFLHF